jgi:hypothetical protein
LRRTNIKAWLLAEGGPATLEFAGRHGSGRLNRERSAPPRDIAVVDEMLTSFIEQQPAG